MLQWFPKFLNWRAALLAAAITVPLLVLLYFLKLRRREVPVSSTFLWKKAVQDLQVNAPFQMLRKNLLLLLQLLILAALAMALSRPISNYTPGAGSVSVILIDRSASMSAREGDYAGRTRIEEAKRQATQLVDTMNRDDRACVIAFDDSAQTICPFTTDRVSLKRAIDSIEPTDRQTRLKFAYRLAEAQAAFNPDQLRPNVRPAVYLYSDGRVLDSDKLSLHADLTYYRIGTPVINNVGIVAMSARRNYERPTEVQVFARLANFGQLPVEADVQLTVDGLVRGVATGDKAAFLLPESWTDAQRADYEKTNGRYINDSIEFPSIELTTGAVVRIEQMHKDGDALPADDAASVVVPPPHQLAVLLVTDGNYFLERAIDALKLQVHDVILPSQYDPAKAGKYDVIIFDRWTPKQLPQIGNFMYFGIVPDALNLKVVRESERPDAPPVMMKDVTILDWKRDHPLLRHLTLEKVYVGEALQMKVPPEDETLIQGFTGPLAALERNGRSNHVIIGFDVLQSNWPLKVSFPVFMHNAMQFLAIGSEMDVREAFAPGATPKIPRTALQQVDPTIKELTLDGPMGRKKIKIPESGDLVLPALEKVGVYTVTPAIGQYDRFAVNLLDANESNLQPSEIPPASVGVKAAAGKARLELWWWIVACGAVPLLLIEWWIYTRRVHL